MGSVIFICLAGLIAGILFACGIPPERVFLYLIPVALAVFSAFLWNFKRFYLRRYDRVSLLFGFCSFFLVGWVSISTNHYHPGFSLAGPVEIRAKVVSYREVTEKMGQVVVSVSEQGSHSVWERRTGKIVLLVKPNPAVLYEPGDQWLFGPLTIVPVSSKASKNGFIPSRYWISRGVRFEARLPAGNGNLVSASRMPHLKEHFNRWQQRLSDRIMRLPLSDPSRSLIKAMILGDRQDVEDDTINNFSKAGIIHVLSVSGLHVGIVYFMIAWLLKRLVFLGPRVRSIAALLVVWLYAGLTGFSPSALRSAGMITLFEFARMGRRGTPGLEVLAATALIHCMINPYTVFSAGAQLSYLAVAGIFLWNPLFNPILQKMNRVSRYFAGAIAISLSAQSLIIPILLFWFGWFPLYFLIGNLFLLPIMVFGFYLGLVILAVDLTRLAIPLLYKVMDLLVAVVSQGAAWLGNLPGNLFKPDGLIWPDLVLYYLILLIFRSYIDRPHPDKIKRILAGTGLIFTMRYLVLFLVV
jgi:competence protein ComEC